MQLRPHPQIANTAISPDGRWVATSTFWGRQSTIKVWDAISGQLVRDLPGEGLYGDARVEFSPDGRWLVLGKSLQYDFYEVRSWRLGRTQPREHGGVAPLAFAPDNKILAILKDSRLVQLIDVATGQELASLASPDPRQIGHLAFSPDGSRLTAACGDGVIQAWDLRYLRQQLADLGLDWDLPPLPATAVSDSALSVKVDLGNLGRSPPRADASADEQVAWYTAQLKDNRDDIEAYHLRGHAYEKLGKYAEAVADFTEAQKRQPGNPHFWEVRGVNYLRLGQHEQAAADFRKSLSLKAEQADVCNNLAWLLLTGPESLRNVKEALPLAERAVKLAPEQPGYKNTLGVALYRVERYEKSIAMLEQSLAVSQGKTDAFDLYFLAMCHAKRGDKEKAKICFDRAVRWTECQKNLPAQWEAHLKAFRAEVEEVMRAK